MADNGNNEGATPVVAALEGEGGSEIPEAPPKKNQKPVEPPVTFREFDVSCISGILSLCSLKYVMVRNTVLHSQILISRHFNKDRLKNGP